MVLSCPIGSAHSWVAPGILLPPVATMETKPDEEIASTWSAKNRVACISRAYFGHARMDLRSS